VSLEARLRELLRGCDDAYTSLDALYLPLDREQILRTRNLRLIPVEPRRRGGKVSYAEWAHVVGVFQTLVGQQCGWRDDLQVLDIGCGSGLLAIACEPFIGRGRYTGIDVSASQIEFCRGHYPADTCEFLHLDTVNPFYAPDQTPEPRPWPLPDAGFDMVTALSVWTHFREEDARFYLAELARVLRSGGRALITLFLLDEGYRHSLPRESGQVSRFHGTPVQRWVFDQAAYGSAGWRCPAWTEVPEQAIGVNPEAWNELLAACGLALLDIMPGNWKERPGAFFQDVLVIEKV